MMGSKNRDYKTEDRAIRRRLARHNELMKGYIATGMDRDQASKAAYADVIAEMDAGRHHGRARA